MSAPRTPSPSGTARSTSSEGPSRRPSTASTAAAGAARRRCRVYDPVTNTWAKAAPLPRSEGEPRRGRPRRQAVRDRRPQRAKRLRRRLRVRPRFGYVVERPSDPAARHRGAAVHAERSTSSAASRRRASGPLAEVYRLAPGTSRWVRIGAMPTARNYAARCRSGARSTPSATAGPRQTRTARRARSSSTATPPA
jgi:hypothetical protein